MEIYFADFVSEYFDYGFGYCVNELDEWIYLDEKRVMKTILLWCCLVLIFGLVTFGGCSKDPIVIIPDGWTYEVFAKGLLRVDNIVFDEQGVLYATLEIPLVGRVIAIENGDSESVIKKLDLSDGLAIDGENLYVDEEIMNGRVIQFNLKTREQRVITRLNKPEGIGVDSSGQLIIVEDDVEGRLLRVSLSGEVEVLAEGFNRPEGVCLTADGRIFFSETGTGRVLTFFEDTVTVLIENLNNPDQVECDADDVLWITEDTRPGRLLRFKEGELSVFAEGLSSPQGITFDKNGAVYVSEQDKNRIICFTKIESSAAK